MRSQGALDSWASARDEGTAASTRLEAPGRGLGAVAKGLTSPATAPVLGVLVEREESALLITPLGEIDLASAERMEHALLGLLKEGATRVTIDISRVSFLDACGVAVLVRCAQCASEIGIGLELLPGSSQPPRLLELCAVLDRFDFDPSG